MAMQSSNKWTFPGAEPKQVRKENFLEYLRNVIRKGEISWLITDTKSFEWAEINFDKKKFLEHLSSLRFTRAFVGVFYPENTRMEYASFRF